MAAKDLYHDHVRTALEKDGWTITDDPLSLKWNDADAFIDLAAEKVLIAEKGAHRIAVEVKSFIGVSKMRNLYEALGQFVLYREALDDAEPDREMFLAVRVAAFQQLFATRAGEKLRAREHINLLVFNEDSREIVQWIPPLTN
jgi:hypothetical protein